MAPALTTGLSGKLTGALTGRAPISGGAAVAIDDQAFAFGAETVASEGDTYPVATGSGLTWSILSGDPSGHWQIDSSTGKITPSVTGDTANLNAGPYALVVQVTDGVDTDSATVTLTTTGTDANGNSLSSGRTVGTYSQLVSAIQNTSLAYGKYIFVRQQSAAYNAAQSLTDITRTNAISGTLTLPTYKPTPPWEPIGHRGFDFRTTNAVRICAHAAETPIIACLPVRNGGAGRTKGWLFEGIDFYRPATSGVNMRAGGAGILNTAGAAAQADYAAVMFTAAVDDISDIWFSTCTFRSDLNTGDYDSYEGLFFHTGQNARIYVQDCVFRDCARGINIMARPHNGLTIVGSSFYDWRNEAILGRQGNDRRICWNDAYNAKFVREFDLDGQHPDFAQFAQNLTAGSGDAHNKCTWALGNLFYRGVGTDETAGGPLDAYDGDDGQGLFFQSNNAGYKNLHMLIERNGVFISRSTNAISVDQSTDVVIRANTVARHESPNVTLSAGALIRMDSGTRGVLARNICDGTNFVSASVAALSANNVDTDPTSGSGAGKYATEYASDAARGSNMTAPATYYTNAAAGQAEALRPRAGALTRSAYDWRAARDLHLPWYMPTMHAGHNGHYYPGGDFFG